ncbi:MAG: DUF3306 domain-containing protein [Geminicoccaceae bacterium]
MAGHDDKSGESGDEGFLSRWSRRKAEAKTADDTAALDPEVVPEAETSDETPSPRDPAEPAEFDVSTLPDIDSLGPGSDFSMFMQAGVPPALKTKALRKLWRVKPELANLDGLLDYGEDLTGSFKVVDHLKTAYEVGRGFLKDQADQAPDDEKAPDEGEAIQDDQIAADAEPAEASSRTSDGGAGATDIASAADEPSRKS